MTVIDAKHFDFLELGQKVRETEGDITIENCLGHRFVAAGSRGRVIDIKGTPGNALGAYNNGADIIVRGNAQDATGDTMNSGSIVIDGSAGDALGYACRGGEIFVRGDSGYRTGIHMKQYKDLRPIVVVGGRTGSFLGEYLAGGLIIVLNSEDLESPVGEFCGTGMHGGKIVIRAAKPPANLPKQVSAAPASEEDMAEIEPYIQKFCGHFGVPRPSDAIGFLTLTPNAANPYTQMYTHN